LLIYLKKVTYVAFLLDFWNENLKKKGNSMHVIGHLVETKLILVTWSWFWHVSLLALRVNFVSQIEARNWNF